MARLRSRWALGFLVAFSGGACSRQQAAAPSACDQARENARRAWAAYLDRLQQRTSSREEAAEKQRLRLQHRLQQIQAIQDCIERINHTGSDLPKECLAEVGLEQIPDYRDEERALQKAREALEEQQVDLERLRQIQRLLEALPCDPAAAQKLAGDLPPDDAEPASQAAKQSLTDLTTACRDSDRASLDGCGPRQ